MSDFERELEAYLDERLALTGSAKHTWITEGARWALESQVVRAMAEALKERDQLRAERDQYKIDMEIADAQAGELRAEVAAAWAEVEHFRNALDLVLYYVEGDATYEGVKMKVEKMLRGEK